MSLAWKEAKKFVDGLDYPLIIRKTEIERVAKEKPFKQGDFTPIYFSPNNDSPDGIGMRVEKSLVFDREGYKKILSFAKERNLTLKNLGERFYFYTSNNAMVVCVTANLFIASDPDLFEEIGTKLYGLRTDTE